MKFTGRDGAVYTVVGKGGLVREVLLPHRLAERLEERRLDAPAPVVDRGVRYLQRYDVGGGQAFSASFSHASMAALGKSRGAHGLRHGYAQSRMRESSPRKWATSEPRSPKRPIYAKAEMAGRSAQAAVNRPARTPAR